MGNPAFGYHLVHEVLRLREGRLGAYVDDSVHPLLWNHSSNLTHVILSHFRFVRTFESGSGLKGCDGPAKVALRCFDQGFEGIFTYLEKIT